MKLSQHENTVNADQKNRVLESIKKKVSVNNFPVEVKTWLNTINVYTQKQENVRMLEWKKEYIDEEAKKKRRKILCVKHK